MTIPKASDQLSSSQPVLSCANCGDNLGDNSRGVHAFQSFINNAPASIFVKAAIKDIYRLNDQTDLKLEDDCVICVHCCLLLSQMFGLFRLFEARQNPEGLLASCCSSGNPALTGDGNFIEVQVTENNEGIDSEGLGQVSFLAVELIDDENDKSSSKEVEENLDQASLNVGIDSEISPTYLENLDDDGQDSADPDYVLGADYSSSESAEEEEEASKHQSKKLRPSIPEDSLSCSNWSKQYLNRESFAMKRRIKKKYQSHFGQSILVGPRALAIKARAHNRSSDKTKFQCADCKLEYNSVTAYEKHRKDDHGDVERPFKCPIIAYYKGDHNLLTKTRITRRPFQNVLKRKAYKRTQCPSPRVFSENLLSRDLETNKKNPISCDICNANFLFAWDLKRHLMYEHAEHPAWARADYPPSSQDNSDVEDNQIKENPSTRYFSCPHCSREFVSKRICRLHLKSVHPELTSFQPHATRIPQSTMNAKKRLEAKAKHLTKEKEEARGPCLFQCADCDQTFETNNLLVCHRTNEHPDEEEFKCPHCLRELASAGTLRGHILKHDEGKDWPCGECSRRFLERLPRDQHLEKAHGMRKAQDDWMPLPLATTLQHLSGEFSQSEKTMAGATTTTKRFQCPDCDEEFIFSNNLRDHRVIVHKVNHSERFKCHLCPNILPSVLSYIEHIEGHGKKIYGTGTGTQYVCSDCGKSFPNRNNLVRHVALIHDKAAGPALEPKPSTSGLGKTRSRRI